LSHLSVELGRGEWGLPDALLDVLLSAQLRAGELVALDARGQSLAPASIGLPLRRSVHRVMRGALPPSAQWTILATLSRALLDFKTGAPSFEEAARFAGALETWREETQSRLELARARSAQLRRALGHSPAQWSVFERAAGTVAGALQDARTDDQSELFERVSRWDGELLTRELRLANDYAGALESAGELLSGHALLSHPDLVCPPDLSDERAQLLELLSGGEDALFDPELKPRLRGWRANYAEKYALWHGAQQFARAPGPKRRTARARTIGNTGAAPLRRRAFDSR